ncbi:MAG: hypothetical protein H7Z40_14000 [Phycisphaerae bacterium]|nr:hypothetical protein [Gemmatimonadaceae bacterium]
MRSTDDGELLPAQRSALENVLHHLHASGVALWIEGSRLRFRAAAGTLTAADRAVLPGRARRLCDCCVSAHEHG